MALHGAVRLDKVLASKVGNIESVQASVDLDNGSFVTIGGLISGKGEIVSAAAPTSVTTQEVLLVASPELVYDEGLGVDQILEFYNEKDKPARAYHLNVGDYVTITDMMIDGTSVVGQYLVPVNTKTKLAPAANLDGETKFAALVVAKEKIYGQAATVFRVLSV